MSCQKPDKKLTFCKKKIYWQKLGRSRLRLFDKFYKKFKKLSNEKVGALKVTESN